MGVKLHPEGRWFQCFQEGCTYKHRCLLEFSGRHFGVQDRVNSGKSVHVRPSQKDDPGFTEFIWQSLTVLSEEESNALEHARLSRGGRRAQNAQFRASRPHNHVPESTSDESEQVGRDMDNMAIASNGEEEYQDRGLTPAIDEDEYHAPKRRKTAIMPAHGYGYVEEIESDEMDVEDLVEQRFPCYVCWNMYKTFKSVKSHFYGEHESVKEVFQPDRVAVVRYNVTQKKAVGLEALEEGAREAQRPTLVGISPEVHSLIWQHLVVASEAPQDANAPFHGEAFGITAGFDREVSSVIHRHNFIIRLEVRLLHKDRNSTRLYRTFLSCFDQVISPKYTTDSRYAEAFGDPALVVRLGSSNLTKLSDEYCPITITFAFRENPWIDFMTKLFCENQLLRYVHFEFLPRGNLWVHEATLATIIRYLWYLRGVPNAVLTGRALLDPGQAIMPKETRISMEQVIRGRCNDEIAICVLMRQLIENVDDLLGERQNTAAMKTMEYARIISANLYKHFLVDNEGDIQLEEYLRVWGNGFEEQLCRLALLGCQAINGISEEAYNNDTMSSLDPSLMKQAAETMSHDALNFSGLPANDMGEGYLARAYAFEFSAYYALDVENDDLAAQGHFSSAASNVASASVLLEDPDDRAQADRLRISMNKYDGCNVSKDDTSLTTLTLPASGAVWRGNLALLGDWGRDAEWIEKNLQRPPRWDQLTLRL